MFTSPVARSWVTSRSDPRARAACDGSSTASSPVRPERHWNGAASGKVITMPIIIKLRFTYPSVYSACSSPRYDSHLLPITLPQVKQRIGIIILTVFSGSLYFVNSLTYAYLLLFLWWTANLTRKWLSTIDSGSQAHGLPIDSLHCVTVPLENYARLIVIQMNQFFNKFKIKEFFSLYKFIGNKK